MEVEIERLLFAYLTYVLIIEALRLITYLQSVTWV